MEFNKGRRRGKGDIAREMENDVSGERETAIRIRERKGEEISKKGYVICVTKKRVLFHGKSNNYQKFTIYLFINQSTISSNKFKKKKIILNFSSCVYYCKVKNLSNNHLLQI